MISENETTILIELANPPHRARRSKIALHTTYMLAKSAQKLVNRVNPAFLTSIQQDASTMVFNHQVREE